MNDKDIIEEQEIPIEDQCDVNEEDTDKRNENKVLANLKAAGVIIYEKDESATDTA